ncbi:TPA: hypothetical protein ACPJ06_004004 [Vibrio diabolicus]
MAVVLENSTLLNKYYDLRALSSLPNQAPFFQFGQVDWGYDLIETIDGLPSAMDIDLDKESIANVFYTSNAAYNYVNGKIIVTTSIPAGELATQKQFSCVGIKDAQGNLIAAAVTQPVWLYAQRSITLEIVIDTARSDALQVAKG